MRKQGHCCWWTCPGVRHQYDTCQMQVAVSRKRKKTERHGSDTAKTRFGDTCLCSEGFVSFYIKYILFWASKSYIAVVLKEAHNSTVFFFFWVRSFCFSAVSPNCVFAESLPCLSVFFFFFCDTATCI